MPFGGSQFIGSNPLERWGGLLRRIGQPRRRLIYPPKKNKAGKAQEVDVLACCKASTCCSSSLARVFQWSRLAVRSRTVPRNRLICSCFLAARSFQPSRETRTLRTLRAPDDTFAMATFPSQAFGWGPTSDVKNMIGKQDRLVSLPSAQEDAGAEMTGADSISPRRASDRNHG